MNYTKKVLKNSFFSMLQQAVNIVTNIILPPIIIAYFGSAVNGLIATIKQIIEYIQLVGAGLSDASIECMYKPLVDKDEKRINEKLNAIAKVFNNAGIWFSLIIVIVACVYPNFIQGNTMNYINTTILIVLLGITGTFEFFILGKYDSLLRADQKMYVTAIGRMVGDIIILIVTIGCIKLNLNVVIVQFFASFVYLFRIAVIIFYIRRNYKYLDSNVTPDFTAISKRKYALVHQVSSTILGSSQIIIISLFCGLQVASIFAVYALIYKGINALLNIISSSLIPSFGSIIVGGNTKALKNIFNMYESVYTMITFILLSITYASIQPFISIYTKGLDINYLNIKVAILFTIIGILNNIRIPANTIIVAIGHFEQTRNRAIIEVTIGILSQLVLVNFLGIEGVLIGVILAYIYRAIESISYANHKILNARNKQTYKKIVVNFVSTFLPALIILQNFNIKCSNYIQWIIYVTIIGTIIALISFMTNYLFDRNNIKDLIKRITGVFYKQKI